MNIPLTEDGELQVQAYLRFAKLKRDQHVREVLSTIRDLKADRVRPGDIYNYQELGNIFDDLEDTVQNLADKELQNAYHANALLVKIMLSQAQAHSVDLQVDTANLENEYLLKQISSSEAAALGRPASDFVRRGGALNKLGTVASIAVQDPALLKEVDELRSKLADMTTRMTVLQEETTRVSRDKSALNTQVNQLKDSLAAAEARASQAAASSARPAAPAPPPPAASGASSKDLERLQQELAHARDDIASLNTKLAAKDKELRELHDVLDGKLQDSKQWQQMKTLMQAKSAEVVALRKKLAQYEPQSVPSAD